MSHYLSLRMFIAIAHIEDFFYITLINKIDNKIDNLFELR